MIDIVLTGICWWRGWGIKSLIPIGISIGIALIVAIISIGLSVNLPVNLLVGINIIIWIGQIWMIFNPPEKITSEEVKD